MKKMKKTLMYVAFMGLLISCGSKKPVVQNYQGQFPQTAPSTNPFGGETYSMPTFEPDTEDFFAASGIAEGPRQRMDVLQQEALTNAQNVIRQKMKHAYQGMISDYSNYMGINANSDAAIKVERGGNQIIDVVVNETMARDVKFSGVDDKGHVTCFVGIRIYKKSIADKIADQISKDDELKLRFNEDQYRKYMQEKFKEYKESQNK
jgi:hypothetical protein